MTIRQCSNIHCTPEVYQNWHRIVSRYGLLAHLHARDGLGYGLGFLYYTEIGSRDPSPSSCNVKCSANCNVSIWFGSESKLVFVSESCNISEACREMQYVSRKINLK